MPDPDFTIKQGDTSPAISAQLRDGTDPIDLTDAIIAFRMDHRVTDTRVSGLCTRTDIEDGRVAYSWNNGDTAETGQYDGEFILDYDYPESIDEFDVDQTFPSDGFLSIHVTETLDG